MNTITQNKIEFFTPGEPITLDKVRAAAKKAMHGRYRLRGAISLKMELLTKSPADYDVRPLQAYIIDALRGVVFRESARFRLIDSAIKHSNEAGIIVVVKELT